MITILLPHLTITLLLLLRLGIILLFLPRRPSLAVRRFVRWTITGTGHRRLPGLKMILILLLLPRPSILTGRFLQRTITRTGHHHLPREQRENGEGNLRCRGQREDRRGDSTYTSEERGLTCNNVQLLLLAMLIPLYIILHSDLRARYRRREYHMRKGIL